MAVEILIRRRFVIEKANEIAPLMVELRSLSRARPGYISSESLRCIDPSDDNEYLIKDSVLIKLSNLGFGIATGSILFLLGY